MTRRADGRSDRERGVALVIVLGLVALVGAWAASAAYQDMVALRREENMLDEARALQACQSAFALAVMALRQDARQSRSDDLEEGWAMQTPAFPIDDGVVSGRIVDANRYLNLNDLVDANGRVQMAAVGIFKRLFERLDLDPSLVHALVDWLDADDRPFGAGGAEDAAYYDAPYRVKNGPLDSWDELRMVKGFDQAVLTKLKDVAVVAPPAADGVTPVNINTASAPVLQALFPRMTDADAEALMAARPYADVRAATNGKPWLVGGNPARLSVASSIFIVRTDAIFGRVDLREELMVRRQGQRLRLISRRRLGWDES